MAAGGETGVRDELAARHRHADRRARDRPSASGRVGLQRCILPGGSRCARRSARNDPLARRGRTETVPSGGRRRRQCHPCRGSRRLDLRRRDRRDGPGAGDDRSRPRPRTLRSPLPGGMSFFASGPEVRASFPRSSPRSRSVTPGSEDLPEKVTETPCSDWRDRCPCGRSRCLSALAEPPVSRKPERQSGRLRRARPRRSRSTQIARYRGECRDRSLSVADLGRCAAWTVRSPNNSRVADRVPLAFQDQWRSGMSSFNVGFVIFPDLTQLDFTGPLQVLARLPQSATHIVAKSEAPVRSDCGLSLVPTRTFASCPPLDLICIPGGISGVVGAIGDRETVEFVRRASGGREVCHLGLHRRVRSRRRRIAQGATGDDALGLHGSLASRRGNVREGQDRKRRQRDHRGRRHRRCRFRSERRSGDCG